MKDNGKIIRQMGREHCIILMEIFIKGNGLKIKQMDMANIFILMEQNIQASGKMTNSMAKEYNNG